MLRPTLLCHVLPITDFLVPKLAAFCSFTWEPLRRTFGSRRTLGLLTALLAPPPVGSPIAAASQLRQQQAFSASAAQCEELLREACNEVAARSAEAAQARQQASAALEREAALREELVRREAVIQHLSRQRDDATAEALCTWRQLWESAVQRSVRSTAALAAVRVRFEEMMQSLRETMSQLEADTEQAVRGPPGGLPACWPACLPACLPHLSCTSVVHLMTQHPAAILALQPCTCCGGSCAAASALRVFAAAGRVAEVRASALHWREQAEDTWLELQAFKGHMQQVQVDACAEVARLQRRCGQAVHAQQERAAAAEALLAQERAQHAATRQQLRQQVGCMWWRGMQHDSLLHVPGSVMQQLCACPLHTPPPLFTPVCGPCSPLRSALPRTAWTPAAPLFSNCS